MNSFIFECKRHVQQNPLDVIAVHCTHGFNRTGFLIAAFLIQTEDWSPEAAVDSFAKARPPGIYKAGGGARRFGFWQMSQLLVDFCKAEWDSDRRK